MMPHIPYDTQLIPFIGDGPTVGDGAQASDPTWGQKEAITSAVSLQYVAAYAIARAPAHQDMSPLASPPAVGTAWDRGQAPAIIVHQRREAHTHIPYMLAGNAGMDLGAPAINTGDTNLPGRL